MTTKKRRVRGVILNPEGTLKVIQSSKLEALQKAVGGNIETLPHRSGNNLVAYVNEEGVMKNLLINLYGDWLHKQGFLVNWDYGGVYGPVVLFGNFDVNGDETSVPESILKELKALKFEDD